MGIGTEVIVVRYGELSLKGQNRGFFERQLVTNLKKTLQRYVLDSTPLIKHVRGRIFIYGLSPSHAHFLQLVFGIVSYSPALEVSIDQIYSAMNPFLSNKHFSTFRVSVDRLDKSLTKTSPEWERELGAYIVKEFNTKVSLKNFDLEVTVEFFDKKCYLFTERYPCLGGLPVGVGGRVAVLLENEASLAAAWLMLKRGCEIILFGKCHGLDVLQRYCPSELKYISSSDLNLLKTLDVEAVVVNDTLNYIRKLDYEGLVLRPLIGYTDQEIHALLERIKEKLPISS